MTQVDYIFIPLVILGIVMLFVKREQNDEN